MCILCCYVNAELTPSDPIYSITVRYYIGYC